MVRCHVLAYDIVPFVVAIPWVDIKGKRGALTTYDVFIAAVVVVVTNAQHIWQVVTIARCNMIVSCACVPYGTLLFVFTIPRCDIKQMRSSLMANVVATAMLLLSPLRNDDIETKKDLVPYEMKQGLVIETSLLSLMLFLSPSHDAMYSQLVCLCTLLLQNEARVPVHKGLTDIICCCLSHFVVFVAIMRHWYETKEGLIGQNMLLSRPIVVIIVWPQCNYNYIIRPHMILYLVVCCRFHATQYEMNKRLADMTGFDPSWSTFLRYCVVSKKN